MNGDTDHRQDATGDELISPQPLVVDGTLDLHTFPPGEVRDLVSDYLEECSRLGILEVRIIHGKGSGTLRSIVHSVLSTHPRVIRFATPSDSGGWGRTVVVLDGPDGAASEPESGSTKY